MKVKMVGSIALLVALCGCSSGGPTGGGTSPKPGASPSASAGVSDAEWAAFWASHGATITPPRDVTNLSKYQTPPTPQNLTGGKVSDAEAAKWVRANDAGSAIEFWADFNLQPDVLRKSGIAASELSANLVFSGDLDVIKKVQAAGGKSEIEDPIQAFVAEGLVAVPQSVRDALAKDPHYRSDMPSADFAIILRSHGPNSVYAVLPDGTRKQISNDTTTNPVDIVNFGRYSEVPPIGGQWLTSGLYACADFVALRDLCSQLK